MDLIRGQNITFFANFVDSNGMPIYAGISGVTIDVSHYYNAIKQYDIVTGTMFQDSGSHNMYYYPYQIPLVAAETTYNVVYNCMFSGSPVQSSEVFTVVPLASGGGSAPGTIVVSGTVVTPSGSGIYQANVSTYLGGSITASSLTDANGNYTVYLNPGAYVFSASKSGYFNNQVLFNIPTGTNYYNVPSISMVDISTYNMGQVIYTSNVGINVGSLTISDTYQWVDKNTQNTMPLPDLKVSLFSIDQIAGGSPIASTFTDASGTFILGANPGFYILEVKGNGPSNDVYLVTYNIEVSNAYAQHSPANFRYLDTSKYNYLV
jgi:hypothetical protein